MLTPRLDNLAAMQSRPLGTNTALYRDPSTEAVGRQYKQQKSDYNMARRLLKRKARRGDERSALGLIDLGESAEKRGITMGGITNRDETNAAIAGRTAAMKQETNDFNGAAQLNRNGIQLGEEVLGRETPAAPRTAAPTTGLGQRAYEVMGARGGKDLGFRQGLDRAIGMAKTDTEMNELASAATEAGISPEAFKRRKNWWDKKR